LKLDVYLPSEHTAATEIRNEDVAPRESSPMSKTTHGLGSIGEMPKLRPVIIFVPSPHLECLPGLGRVVDSSRNGDKSRVRTGKYRRWLFSSLGRNLASMGYIAVIPDISNYFDGEGKVREMIEDVRGVAGWVERCIGTYCGDSSRISLMGHGFGAHLALLTTIQDAVVRSRDDLLSSGSEIDVPNGVKKLELYGEESSLGRFESVIALSSITDVEKHIAWESIYGVQHLSNTRRILGPSHTICMFHSPAHILFASRNVVNVDRLPAKFLFIHGDADETTHHTQSGTMKELLRGVGVADVQLKLHDAGHVAVLTALMFKMDEPCSRLIREQLESFLPIYR